MQFRLLIVAILAATLAGCAPVQAKSDRSHYGNNQKASSFIDEMVKQHGFDRTELENLFSQAERREDILELMRRPAEKTKP
ncbi:MAG: lytic murein transglycosylase, partial [Gammaproteobacteria bacterium]